MKKPKICAPHTNSVAQMKFAMMLTLTALFLPAAIFACSFDTDCNPGSKCAKASGSIYGVCLGGISPGNNNDSQPVQSPLDPNKTYGNTCSFDTDCGQGSQCIKQGGIKGVCMRGR